MITLRDLLLLLCLIGGVAGAAVGVTRRDISTALQGLLVVAISTYGLLI
jgi:uncharacterized membrane protein YuzA (DUF378 family)